MADSFGKWRQGWQRRTLPGEGDEHDFCDQKRRHEAVVKSPSDLRQRACALMTARETQAQRVHPGRGL